MKGDFQVEHIRFLYLVRFIFTNNGKVLQMYVRLYVLQFLILPGFSSNWDLTTDIPKNPKYKGLGKFVWWESPGFIRADGRTLGQKYIKKPKNRFP